MLETNGMGDGSPQTTSCGFGTLLVSLQREAMWTKGVFHSACLFLKNLVTAVFLTVCGLRLQSWVALLKS